MESSSALVPRVLASSAWKVPDLAGLGLGELRNRSPLRIQILPSGALFALWHGDTLINQVLPGPADNGLFRLCLRWHDDRGVAGWAPLVGAGLWRGVDGDTQARWSNSVERAALDCAVTLCLHPVHAAWVWQIAVRNVRSASRRIDVLLAQDLGLADEGAVRNNEAYTSQYIDVLPVHDAALGWTILARQNQPTPDDRRPWLALACADGAKACCTDGWQFFGADHRLTGEPVAMRVPQLPSRRLQYECALGGLQSHTQEIAPSATGRFVFVARFLEDHPAASAERDLDYLRQILPANWVPASGEGGRRPPGVAAGQKVNESMTPGADPDVASSIFVTAQWLHGDRPAEADLAAWFPGARRHEERGGDGFIQSFFHGEATHVVTRDKEALVQRPHGHILRSGDATWIDETQFGVTCYAAGIFGAQAYLGNPSFARLLSVVRNPLNVARAGGQRVFVRRNGDWCQLGVPSAFAMTPGDVRWIYRVADEVIEARVWCSPGLSASFLELRVASGSACEFLISHELVLGAVEFAHAGEVTLHRDAGWMLCQPGAESLVGVHQPGVAFAIAAADCGAIDELGGDELLHAAAARRSGTYAVLRTKHVTHCGVILLGTLEGPVALPSAVDAVRVEYAGEARAAQPAPLPWRIGGLSDPAIARLADVLPWFNHNAAIHFSAPHGLEQCGGAAWGVRDVCQGSVEWLLAAGRFAIVRRVLETVFAQQYAPEGTWPQWFMHPPYRFAQQTHCHGDVCFWPVKALCDYVAASNDFTFLQQRIGYTDSERFVDVGPEDSLWTHCDRVVAHVESRFVAGTMLVNYGDGDWDDTLQPADPAMRTRMISAWTVALAFQTLQQLAELSQRAGEIGRATRLRALLTRMDRDFHEHLMPGGIVAGFLVTETGGARPLLHPSDTVTGIRYRLLPMTRAVIAELFTPGEARHHLDLVARELRSPDGVRLMSEPVPYRGGVEHWFKRAETAANFGREIGLHYVHAHLRYAEALAKIGDADDLWHALQVVNPVGLAAVVGHAAPRQSNVYFSSSDADFADRYEAAARWSELRRGEIPVRGGWRLYSSGPGLFLHKVRTCLLGLRESYGDFIFDPVLPRRLDGLVAEVQLGGRPVRITYRVKHATHGPSAILVDGARVDGTREPNPYRPGGWRVRAEHLAGLLGERSEIEIEL